MAKEKELNVEERLKALYELQTILSEVDRIKTLRGELPLEVQDLEDEIEGLQTRISKYDEEIAALNATIKEQSEAADKADAMVAKYTKDQDNVRNNREYDFLTKEIEYQQLNIELAEKKINDAKHAIDVTNANMDAAKTQLEDCTHVLAEKKGELDEMEEQLEKQAIQQSKIIAEKQAFIERFRYKASKAKQAQSRLKQLEKMETVQLLQNRKKVRFHFPDPERPPQILLELRHVSKSYDDNVVYKDINFRIYRGDKIALCAPNGAGKSTLIKILANIIPFEGERLLSDRVHLAHFAQHQIDALDFSKTLLP